MPDALGLSVVSAARAWVGTPFHWGASVRGAGCDCKGLVAGIARDLGLPEGQSFEAVWTGYGRHVDPARLCDGLARVFDPVPGEWQPGDVLLLNIVGKPRHLGIYAGAGRMIHTYGKGPACVVEVPMGNVWRAAVASAWRWKGGQVDG